MLKKAILATAVLALTSSPAWALPGKGQSTSEQHKSAAETHRSEAHGEEGAKGGEHGAANRGKGNGKANGKSKGEHGKSHKCKPHKVAYVASGTLVSDSLQAGENGTFSGELTVEVLHTNHHAREAKGKTETYAVEGVHVHGPVSVEALEAGDRVRLIGGITVLKKKCEAGEFTPVTTIRKLVFHAPKTS